MWSNASAQSCAGAPEPMGKLRLSMKSSDILTEGVHERFRDAVLELFENGAVLDDMMRRWDGGGSQAYQSILEFREDFLGTLRLLLAEA